MNEDSHYKREEERKWRESVESRLVSLTTSQKVSDDQMDEMAVEIGDIEETIRGSKKDRDGGLVEQVNRIDTGLNSMRAILNPSSLGEGGLLNEFRDLRSKVSLQEKRLEYRWSFLNSATASIASILIALISAGALLITNWDKISTYFKKEKSDPVTQMIETAKHPKARRRHVVIREEPPEPAPQESDSDPAN